VNVTFVPLHIVLPLFAAIVTDAGKVLFTVILNVPLLPVQVWPAIVSDGVTVTFATTAALLLLVAMNDAILPVPLEANPIDDVEFVQL